MSLEGAGTVLSGAQSFGRLVVNSSGTYSFLESLAAADGIDLEGGELTYSSVPISHGILTIRPGTVTGEAFEIKGGTLTGTADHLTIAGDLTLSSGTLTAPSAALSVEGDLTISGGTFVPGTGTLILSGTEDAALSTGQDLGDLFINNGLVGYWRFDEGSGSTVQDLSGYGNNGTMYNMTAEDWVSDKPKVRFSDSHALDFDGLNDHISVGGSRLFKYRGGEFTASMWVKKSSADADAAFLISKYFNAAGLYHYYLSITSGNVLRFYLRGNNSITFDHPVAVTPDVWQHVAVTLDADRNVVLYLNGVPAATTHNITDWDRVYQGDRNGSLVIGGQYAYGNGWAGNTGMCLQGKMDEVRIYQRTLSSDEIGRLAAGRTPQISEKNVAISGAVDVSGDMTLHAGTLTADAANPLTVLGAWRNTGGVFAHNSGTVSLTGEGEILSGGSAFDTLSQNSSGTYTLNDDLAADTVLEVTGGTLTQTTDLEAVAVTGDMTVNGGTYAGTAKALAVEGDVTVSAGTFTAPSSTLIANTLTHTGGAFSANGGTVHLSSNEGEIIDTSGGTIFNGLSLNDGLLAYWKMDEVASPYQDSSGNAHDAVWTAWPPVPSEGLTRLDFSNPQSAYFNAGNNYALNAGDVDVEKDLTMCVWIKRDSNSVSHRYLNKEGSYNLSSGGSGTVFQVALTTEEGTSWRAIGLAGPITDWHHYCVTYDGAAAGFYRDGVVVGAISAGGGAIGGRLVQNDNNLTIGHSSTSPYALDDLRIYQRVLSAGEVQALYEGSELFHAAQTYTQSGALDVNGAFTLSDGTFDVSASPSVNYAGDITLGSSSTYTKPAVGTTLDGSLTYTDMTEAQDFGDVVISSGTTTLASNMTVGELTVSDGTGLSPVSYTLDVKNDLTLGAASTLTPGTSTIRLSGTAAQAITSNSKTYSALTVTNVSAGGITFADGFTTTDFTAQD
ncbi:MAG: hypothetical protein GX606_07675, partial [Elusimicrobia bacterium]|nr:hypothetical protein [Elusimicrobiota bacterium]